MLLLALYSLNALHVSGKHGSDFLPHAFTKLMQATTFIDAWLGHSCRNPARAGARRCALQAGAFRTRTIQTRAAHTRSVLVRCRRRGGESAGEEALRSELCAGAGELEEAR